MSNQAPQQQNYQDDEIDLRKLFQAIGRFFINIGHSIINIILSIRSATLRYKILLGAVIILGGMAGVAFNKISKPYYKTSLLLNSSYLNAKLVENSIDKLNLLCEEEIHDGLAKTLNISADVADNINKFDFMPFVSEVDRVEIELLKQKLETFEIDQEEIDKIIKQIEIENKNTYLISVQLYDTDIIDDLQDALVGYFKNNPYVANRIKANRFRQEQLMQKLSIDVSMLDSLKGAYNLNLKLQASKTTEASNSVFLGESGAVNPVSVYSQSVTLFQQYQSTKRNYDLGSDFELVDGFTTFSKPESPGLLKSVVIVAGIFLGLAYLLIIFIEINKYLNRIEKHGFKEE